MQCLNGISRIKKISKFATFHLCWSLCDLFMQVAPVVRWLIVDQSLVRPRMTHEKGKCLANSSQAPCVTFSHRLHSSSSRCTKSYAPVLRMTHKWLFIRACSCSTTSQFDRWPCAQCADRQLSLVALLSCFTTADCWFLAE